VKLQLAPQPPCLRACSACAGDYEDPEPTTASEVGEEEGEAASADETERSEPRDKFPAPEK